MTEWQWQVIALIRRTLRPRIEKYTEYDVSEQYYKDLEILREALKREKENK